MIKIWAWTVPVYHIYNENHQPNIIKDDLELVPENNVNCFPLLVSQKAAVLSAELVTRFFCSHLTPVIGREWARGNRNSGLNSVVLYTTTLLSQPPK